ncbi:iron ABC transporter permease [Brevibacillus humidisoli]|uniref:FecCD family ABC transporter permease n=1 Tax=Brevibacillus humidisoli TaxID=2895522 RepID=UPI001E5DA97F|nr:iron ABC transporter permease [Brevibacillus humidisoli]UFJ39571.1 iron ABC transporter permease [Brevibacillus humidisoli]
MSKYLSLRSHKPPFSFLIHKKTLLVTLTLLVVLVLAALLCVGIGSLFIPPWEVVKTLFGAGEEAHRLVVMDLRLPRITMAILVGASLAVAGAILQSVVRNPLASPDMLGITHGATAAAVAFITVSGGKYSVNWLPLVALFGAFFTAAINYLTAWRKGVSPLRLVLIGVSLSVAMSALTSFIMVAGPTYLASQALSWMSGTVYGSAWGHVLALLPWVIVLIPLSFAFSSKLNVQELGDSVATGLGDPVEKHRLLLIAISVCLAGSAVGMAGGITFIGLMAPHIARKLVGPTLDGLLPVSALIGSLLLLLADLIGRTLFLPNDVPAGVFTAAIGAPFFIYLLYRSRKG